MPILNKPEQFGDLYIEVSIVLPSTVNKADIPKLQKIFPPKVLKYDESKISKVEMKQITQKEKRAKEEEDEGIRYGPGQHRHGENVQCAQQ